MLDACPSIIGYLPKYYWILAQILLDTCPSIIGYFVTCPMMKTNGYRFLCQVPVRKGTFTRLTLTEVVLESGKMLQKDKKSSRFTIFPHFSTILHLK